MYFIYFDEIKYQKNVIKYHLLCGILIKSDSLQALEEEMDEVSFNCFGTKERTSATEFHARDMVLKKKIYQSYDESKITDIYKALLNLILKYKLDLIDIKINVENLSSAYKIKNVQNWALVYMLENVNEYMKEISSKVFMIGDYDGEFSSKNISQFNDYKLTGTSGYKKTIITEVVDSLHYAHSVNSRLLQLADIYAYTRMLSYRETHRNKIAAEIVSYWNALCLKPVKIKNWPEQKMLD